MPASRVNLRGGPVANRTLPETDADASARYQRAPGKIEEDVPVSSLLALSRLIDRLSDRIGHTIYWLILVTVLIRGNRG